MKFSKMYHRSTAAVLVAVLALLALLPAVAQDGVRVRERVMQFKKMRLIETLNMDESTAEKFFVKYNAAQNAIEEARQALNRTIEQLDEAVQKKAADKVKELTELSLRQHEAMQSAVSAMFTAVRPLLTEEQYARFVVFEVRFPEEVRKILMELNREERRKLKRRLQNDGSDDEDDAPPPPRRRRD